MTITPFVGAYRDKSQNLIQFRGEVKFFPRSLDLSGHRNRIVLGDASDLSELDILVGGNDNLIYIGIGSRLAGQIQVMGHDQTVQIGDNTVFEQVNLFASENTNVRIGNDCQLATGIDIRTSVSHELAALASRHRLNPPGSIIIGENVCIEKNVTISKGVTIFANSVVTANAFVNQSFKQENVMIGGRPARILRENIGRERPRLRLEE